MLGSLAAIVGAILYYAVGRLTNINFSLVAIVVGFLVGKAVRKGTGNRGGLLYQFLALFLTYSSIAAMNLPLLIEELVNEEQQKEAVQVANEKAGPAAKADADAADGEANANAKAPAPDAEVKPDPDAPTMSMGQLVLALLLLTYSLPVFMAIASPISGLIYAFGLWEAWRLNKGIRLVFNGPYRLAEAGGAIIDEEVSDGT